MSKKKAITPFALMMINVAAIASLRNLPVTAIYGFHLIFYLALAAIFFFVPVALVASELVTHNPQEGGIYIWVRKAFGKQWGFLAIWLQWIGNIIWYPTILTFIASTLAALIHPKLGESAWFIFATVLVIFWGCTWANMRGMAASSRISTLGVMIGTLLPGAMIIFLGIHWWISGMPMQISVGWDYLIPNHIGVSHIALLSGIALSFVGMEMSEVHASDVAHPQKTFPKAIFGSALIIFLIYAFGSLAIAFVIPPETMNLTGGVIYAFELLLNAYNLEWLTPIFAICIILGVITGVSTWIVGPSRGILIAAEEGHLPAFLCKRNKAGMPAHIMVLQGIIVTVLSSVFLFMPSINSAFIFLTVLASQAAMIMYALMFAAAHVLRRRQGRGKKLFSVPALPLCLLFGFIGVITIFIAGFFPPDEISPFVYEAGLIIGLIIGCVLPFGVHHLSSRA